MFATLSAAAALLVAAGTLATPRGASAHEERTVGEYEVEVGFFEEPALVDQLNGVFLGVLKGGGGDQGEEEGIPVLGLDESLKVELIVGGGAAKKELGFETIEGEPGVYVARFVPTVTGDYTFRIFGNIEDLDVDESFESGPGRFDPVESLDEIAFPEVSGDDASLAQTVQELQARVDALDSGSSSDSTARTLAVIGIVAGLAGLGAGGFGAMRRRS